MALVVLTAALLQGCATSRSVVDIQAPEAASPSQMASQSPRPSLYIRQISDERQFEEAPRSADIPSLGFEGANAASAELKSRAVGRKRNGYGKALGDVLLPEDTTVADLIRTSASHGFEEAGWRVVNSPDTSQDVETVDIAITRFWTWVKPGFWAIALNTDIETSFSFSGQHQLPPIHTHIKDSMQMITDGDWKETIEATLDKYRDAIAEKASP